MHDSPTSVLAYLSGIISTSPVTQALPVLSATWFSNAHNFIYSPMTLVEATAVVRGPLVLFPVVQP